MIKIIQFVQYIIFSFLDIFIHNKKQYYKKTILLIRLDAIGDYILFRNFIAEIKKNKKYQDYKITLLGNIVYKNIAEELDGKYIDKFIWIDRKKFNRNLIYRFNKLKGITANGYELIINSGFSRDFLIIDNIVKRVYAKEKIGSKGDLSNMQKWQKNISDKYYIKLIDVNMEVMFEFCRNKNFFESFLKRAIDIQKPSIELKNKILNFKLPDKYIILFIGASTKFRKWDIKKFAQVGAHIKKKYGYEIVLCGALSDKYMVDGFEKFFQDKYVNLVGKTSLVDLLPVIKNCEIIVSNETSAPHLAVALNVKNIFVIYNGNHYGRFTPYPKSIYNNYFVIYHPKIKLDIEKYKLLSNSHGYSSDLDINEITVETVIHKIDKVLNSKN